MTTKITEKNISNIANRFIQWQSVITADGSTATSAVAGQGYLIDTTSATHTINLPLSASNGDSIVIKDYAGTFNTNNLTIGRNGHNIQGAANDSLISSNRASLTLVYIDSTRGWVYTKESNVVDLQASTFITATGGTVTESGDYKIHSFTGDGCFVVSQVGNPAGGPSNVDYLVVAGGGSGGQKQGGGGGAGGYRTTFPSPSCNAGSFPITVTTYPITVGGGGAARGPGPQPIPDRLGLEGSPSIFSTITSTGGGGGNTEDSGLSPTSPQITGGSGGGASGGNSPGNQPGDGNTPPTTPPQGNPGGAGGNQPGPGYNISGGGGGATAAGGNFTAPNIAGPGGAGAPNTITGSDVTYAGGGGGGYYGPGMVQGTGGAGGGGDGGIFPSPISGTNGTANTGGGGGGASEGPGAPYTGATSGAGGKGIVIIRYKFQ